MRMMTTMVPVGRPKPPSECQCCKPKICYADFVGAYDSNVSLKGPILFRQCKSRRFHTVQMVLLSSVRFWYCPDSFDSDETGSNCLNGFIVIDAHNIGIGYTATLQAFACLKHWSQLRIGVDKSYQLSVPKPPPPSPSTSAPSSTVTVMHCIVHTLQCLGDYLHILSMCLETEKYSWHKNI